MAEQIIVKEQEDDLSKIVESKYEEVECDFCGVLAHCKVNRRGEYYCSPSCRKNLAGGDGRAADLCQIFSSEFQRALAYQSVRFR